MERLKGILGLIVLYLLMAFIVADWNPFDWHWAARAVLVESWIIISVFFEVVFGSKE